MSAAVIPRPSEDAATSTAAVETDDGWMSMNQLREFCGGVSRASVYRWIRLDILPLLSSSDQGRSSFLGGKCVKASQGGRAASFASRPCGAMRIRQRRKAETPHCWAQGFREWCR
jgi:hypothetical protein